MMATRRRASSLQNTAPDRAAGLDDDWGPTPMAVTATPRKAAPKRPRITSGRIPPDMFQRINELRDATGDTHEQWFADALDAVWDDVRAEYEQRARGGTQRFPRPQRRTRRPGGPLMAQYALRLPPEVGAALEELWEAVRPPSRSEFLTTIVRLRLAQLDGRAGAADR